MPSFRYKAIDAKGLVVSGVSAADTLDSLTDILKGQGLFLMEAAASAAAGSTAAKPSEERFARSGDKASIKDVATFTTELMIMVRTALPILQSLESLARQQAAPAFKAVLLEIFKSVRGGMKLSEAFGRFPKIFDAVYISLLAAGEAGGNLPLMLERIVGYLNFRRTLDAKVRSALLYPCIVVAVSISVVTFLVIYILPTFAEIFKEFDVALPLPTRILLALSAHLRQWWYLYLAGAAMAWSRMVRWAIDGSRTQEGAALRLSLPLIGPLERNIVMTRVLRILSALATSGVPILQSLTLARAAAGNAVFDELLEKVYQSASEGQGLATAFARSPHFPQQVANMIANAERTGTLPEVLTLVADHCEAETDTALRNFFAVLEPAFVVLLGVIVSFIAVSILMPMFELGNAIK